MPVKRVLKPSANISVTYDLARKSPALPHPSKAVNKEESVQEQQASSTLPSRSSGHLMG